MPTPENEDRINMAADTQIDSTIIKLATQYADLERRAKELNEEKAQIRKNADAIGISSLAWQIGVRVVKIMSKGEKDDFVNGFKRVTDALGDRQKELFPEDAERARKRAERAAARAAEAKTKAGVDPDTNPRSDPNAGGAKPQTLKEAAAASEAAVQEAIKTAEGGGPKLTVVGTGDQADLKSNVPTPPNPPGEAEEGEAALNDGLSQTKSQSQIAAEKRAAAKVP